ncbi:MAG: AbrB/MazE/SpoVT family DNA-binding domain-containing protein [Candidatus Aenigmarchaeota archaeon]|nr:AbrB/MazE/SpoVT family DNA-binding domain-containing protein [Candidatus Aenigmarchaeota archaeon]
MVKKMEKIRLEKQGRILIPKGVREKLGVRAGEEMSIQVERRGIVLRAFKSPKDFSAELKGCVKESRIDPLTLKKIWEM